MYRDVGGVDAGVDGQGGNPLHLMRDISLKKCEDIKSNFQLWGFR